MTLYYNAKEDLIGYSSDNNVLIRISECDTVFRVMTCEWEMIGEL